MLPGHHQIMHLWNLTESVVPKCRTLGVSVPKYQSRKERGMQTGMSQSGLMNTVIFATYTKTMRKDKKLLF